MSPRFPAAGVLAFLGALPSAAEDIAGASDHPAIGRFAGASITAEARSDYDVQRMLTGLDPEEYADLEGRVTRLVYDMPEGATPLAVRRGFEQALTEDGWEILVSCRDAECGRGNLLALRETVFKMLLNNEHDILTARREADGGLAHVQIVAAPRWTNVNVVEQAAFENKVIDAAAVQSTLEADGRMAFYDIHFETGSATLTADSDATIGVIAQVLAADTELGLIVVGHTDNVGGMDPNLALSRNRAQSVVDRLTGTHGVPLARLTGAGVGFLAPVASNATEEGRALNRRVEIVVR